MVSGFPARPADGDHCPGVGARRHRRGAGPQLDHRHLLLALGVRRLGHRRPHVDRAVVGLRPRGHPGRSAPVRDSAAATSACPTAICSPAPPSSPPVAPASRATGAWRSASPGSPPTWSTASATARGGRQPQHPALGVRLRRGADRRLDLAAPETNGVSSRLCRGVLATATVTWAAAPCFSSAGLRPGDQGRAAGRSAPPSAARSCRAADDRERADAADTACRYARHHLLDRDLGRRDRAVHHGRYDPERGTPLAGYDRATSSWAACCWRAASSACCSSGLKPTAPPRRAHRHASCRGPGGA